MSDNIRSQPVSLGCGTLILIGLIVLFFSGGGDNQKVENELHKLRTEIVNLKTTVEKQTQEIQQLRGEVGQVDKNLQQEEARPQ